MGEITDIEIIYVYKTSNHSLWWFSMWHLISLLNNLIFFAQWQHFDIFYGAILRKFMISQQYTALLHSWCILVLQHNIDIGWYISINNCMCTNGHQNETVKDTLHSWWPIFERNCFKKGRCLKTSHVNDNENKAELTNELMVEWNNPGLQSEALTWSPGPMTSWLGGHWGCR